MKHVKSYKMSLMEKDKSKVKENDKCNYIVKNTANLDIETLLKEQDIKEEDWVKTTLETSKLIYEDLVSLNKSKIDSIGLWITFDDGSEIDNSIDINILESIKKYGVEGVEPIEEFFKMTIENLLS